MDGLHTHLNPVPVGKLSPNGAYYFDLRPDDEVLARLRDELGLLGLRKLRLHGKIVADGKKDWRLTGRLGGTVTQPCVVTLEPVTTRLEEEVTRRFLKVWPPKAEESDEVEMPEDESIDPLREEIDLFSVLTEALALGLPVYPRAKGAAAEQTEARPAGADPNQNGGPSAFAALADFKKKLEDERK